MILFVYMHMVVYVCIYPIDSDAYGGYALESSQHVDDKPVLLPVSNANA